VAGRDPGQKLAPGGVAETVPAQRGGVDFELDDPSLHRSSGAVELEP
jgi:hypothetical protein